MNAQSRAHRKPPDVEEALSSMLWTPYDNNLSESDSSDEPEVLQRLNNNAASYSFFGTGPNHEQRRRQQQSLMRRSLSAWSYRARASGKPGAGELQAGNRFSYPYYDHTELAVGPALGGWDGFGGFGGTSNHVNGNGPYDSYGVDHPGVTGSSYSIHGSAPHHRAPWQTVQPPAGTEGAEKQRPYLQLQTPFVGRWHRVPAQDGASGATPLETSSLPFSLLALDNPPAKAAAAAACMLPPGSRSSDDGFADSYRADYQVYPAGGNGEPMPFGGPRNGNSADTTSNNNNYGSGPDGTCNKSLNNGGGDSGEQHGGNSLCIISAMLNPTAHPGDSRGNGGDLHFSAHNQQHHFQPLPSPPSPGAVPLHHRWLHRKSASTCLVVENDGTHTGDGRPGQVPPARTPSQWRTAEGGEKETDGSRPVVSHTTAGSSARQANGEASSSSSSSSSLSLSLIVGGAQKDRLAVASAGAGEEGSSSRSASVEAMRLNVPAAGLAEGSRTSVYIPSSSQSSSTSSTSSSSSSSSPCSGADGGLQALTIQVNRLDPNNQQQNDVVNNQSSGVSIVSCYRAATAASVSGGPEAGAESGIGGAAAGAGGVKACGQGTQTQPQVNDRKGSVRADNGGHGRGDNGERRRRPSVGVGPGDGDGGAVEGSAVNSGVVNSSSEQMVQVSSGHPRPPAGWRVPGEEQRPPGAEETREGGAAPQRTYTSTEAQTDDTIQVQPQPLQQATTLQLHAASSPLAGPAGVGPYGGSPGPEPAPMLGVHVGSLLMGGSPPPLVGGLPPGASEFSTREHRRRERRERRQARNRLQHIHPLEPPAGPGGPGLHHRSPPPIEIIPDILHSHLPPPYTTLPMGASLIPQMIPANAAAAAAAAVAAASAIPVRAADDCRYTFPIPIMRSSPSERSRKGCCGHWFAGPPLRALIAVVALGGVACALGGAALGATGLAGSPTSHLTAALLMIGVGVILVTVSGAAWRMTAPGAPPCLGLGSTVDLGRCSRRPCGRGGSTPHGLLYPEFQHRPPPPSYQASMQEYRLRLLLLDRDRQSGRMRSTASPPPTYRSNVGSLLRIPLSSRYNNGGSSNSIFGGISGIISGAVGSSSNSVNNVPPGADPQVNSSPNGPPEHPPNPYADGHSTLPPSYRSVHLGVETLQRHTPPSPQAQPLCTANGTNTSSNSSSSSAAERVGHTSDDSIPPTGAAKPSSGPAGGGATHHTPSIIKIDDRRHSMVPSTEGIGTPGPAEMSARRRSSVPGASLIDTREEGPPSRNDGNGGKSGSINGGVGSRPCTVGAGEPTISSSLAGGTGKDLVTIVTISGTIEPSSNGSGKAVYTTSSGSGAAPASSTGATCTLLNSNSTPLLATVIPVSKASSGGAL